MILGGYSIQRLLSRTAGEAVPLGETTGSHWEMV